MGKSSGQESARKQLPSSPRIKRLTEELKNDDSRTDGQVDRDRLLYCSHFARLAEVTQVVSADHGYVFHNRLTHSLKVAQIARRMSEYLIASNNPNIEAAGGLCPDVCEAAALAHDIGHPPFGHIAELVLDEELKRIGLEDGYEGNAQSFRIVTTVAVGDGIDAKGLPIEFGLNLTQATLNAILKYPWNRGENKDKPEKWGAYKSEQKHFDFARNVNRGNQIKSLEAEIMDWADDITYAVHDVVDFYCAGKIPLQELVQENSEERKQFFEEVFERNPKMKSHESVYKGAFERVIKNVFLNPFVFPFRHYTGARYERVTLWQKMTKLITRYISALEIETTEHSLVKIDPNLKHEIEMLKQLTWHYVILNTDLATLQHGQKHIVRTVLNELWMNSKNLKSKKLFPPFFEKNIVDTQKNDQARLRVVADYVSSMTEREIVSVHKNLSGYDVGPYL